MSEPWEITLARDYYAPGAIRTTRTGVALPPVPSHHCPGKCQYCGEPLPPRRRRYCSDEHRWAYHLDRVTYVSWADYRAAVLARDPTCVDCGRAPSEAVHHVVPISRGGREWCASNVVGLCVACHRRRHRAGMLYAGPGDRRLDDYTTGGDLND